jgi:16S rRNA (cytidine1402-2'-O)-methyltransferase
MGTLVLVATPIGNLADLAPRAVATLAAADLVCCEDTRRSGRLLQHAGVTATRLRRVDDHTEQAAVAAVLSVLDGGGTVAVVTDAGMPGISDPGARLVRAAVAAGHIVSAVPGPSALTMAVVISGIPADRFVFEGFLPRSGRARTDRLGQIAAEQRAVVLYEAPHRVERTVGDLLAVCGPDRQVALCRELTKLHEEVWRGTLDGAATHLRATDPIGEYVVVLAGASPPSPATDDDVTAMLRRYLSAGMSTRDAAARVATDTGRVKRDVYALAVAIGQQ